MSGSNTTTVHEAQAPHGSSATEVMPLAGEATVSRSTPRLVEEATPKRELSSGRKEGLEPSTSQLLRLDALPTELFAQMCPAVNRTTAQPMVGSTSETLLGSLCLRLDSLGAGLAVSSSAGHGPHSIHDDSPVKPDLGIWCRMHSCQQNNRK
jgi:hypothetical protein